VLENKRFSYFGLWDKATASIASDGPDAGEGFRMAGMTQPKMRNKATSESHGNHQKIPNEAK